jgi:hypothetical protein
VLPLVTIKAWIYIIRRFQLYFHSHECIISQSIKLLDSLRTLILSFPSFDLFIDITFYLLGRKLEYTSVI